MFRKKAIESKELPGMTEIIEKMEKFCGGDFSVRAEISQDSPLFPIANGINCMLEDVGQLVTDVSLSMSGLVSSALKEGVALDKLAGEFEEQSASVSQLSTAAEELTASVTDIAEASSSSASQVSKGGQTVEHTRKQVAEALDETSKAQEQLGLLKGRMEELNRAASQINGFVSVIKTVAAQTNLLALNAAIEAARAGEHGRGFAVVADEVRKLADQSSSSVGEISGQVAAILEEVAAISFGFSQMEQIFVNNVQAVRLADDSVEQLVEVFQAIDEAVLRLAPIAQEQSATFEEMSASLEDISKRVQLVNLDLQDSNKNLFELISEAEAIRSKISNLNIIFKPQQFLELAKTDHLLWKARVDYMLKGIVDLDENKVKDHHVCRLGKWYFGTGKANFGSLEDFKRLDLPHHNFHQSCAEAIRLYKSGDRAGAKKKSLEIELLSAEVLQLLDQMKLLVS